MPEVLVRFLDTYTEADKSIMFKQLTCWRSEVLSEIRNLKGSKPNAQQLGRLKRFQKSIEDAIDQLGDEASTAKKL